MRYAHTLLFTYPRCNLPISVSQIRSEKNLEMLESMSLRIK
jgi:hypothetical protein